MPKIRDTARMQTRILGSSDLRITPLGFGTWATGGGGWQYGWGAQDDADSIAAIHRALELGINWIDTAPVYGMGHAEEVVARALADWPHERPLVFTKCGLAWNEQGEVSFLLKEEAVRREVEDSLRRLRVDVIDLYQLHWPTDDLAATEEAWGAMADLQKQGKVRWIGASNFSVAQLQAVQRIAPVASLQPPYSLMQREVEKDVLPFCQRENIGVIVYSPMASGLLSGAMTRERVRSFSPEDWRSRSAMFQEPGLTQGLAFADRLGQVGRRHQRSAGAAAIAWTLRNPAVTGAIVGARRPAQWEDVIGAADFSLSAEEIGEIEGEPGSD